MKRLLGAAWAAVHGPAGPGELPAWTLDLGFGGILPAPAPRPIDWRRLHAKLGDLPFRFGAIRLCGVADVEDRPDAGLASKNAGDREQALAAIGRAVDLGRCLGVPSIVLEPGRIRLPGEPGPIDLADRSHGWTRDAARAQLARRNALLPGALDNACRALHALCREHPDHTFCLGPSRAVTGLGDAAGLSAIFDDLRGYRLRYWHDTAITACRHQVLGEEQGEWLERFAGRMGGLTLGDTAGADVYLPPGAGLVDYPLLASYMGRLTGGLPAVVELDPGVAAGEIQGVHAFLTKFGL